jgi:hypothetical protein
MTQGRFMGRVVKNGNCTFFFFFFFELWRKETQGINFGSKETRVESTSPSPTPSPSLPTRDMPVAQEIIIVFSFRVDIKARKKQTKL